MGVMKKIAIEIENSEALKYLFHTIEKMEKTIADLETQVKGHAIMLTEILKVVKLED